MWVYFLARSSDFLASLVRWWNGILDVTAGGNILLISELLRIFIPFVQSQASCFPSVFMPSSANRRKKKKKSHDHTRKGKRTCH